MKLLKKKIIFGCDSRGDGDSPYLTRLTVFECKLFAVYLHKFHRSDHEDFHDHPWAFASLILWRGYEEETPLIPALDYPYVSQRCVISVPRLRKRVWPGMLLFRRATHVHRVVLVKDRPAYSLVVRGPYVRVWGFFTGPGQAWQNFKDYFSERGC